MMTECVEIAPIGPARRLTDGLALPAFLKEEFSARGYYGTLNHNAKAVYQYYFAWWDGIPAHFYQHPPEERATRFVDLLGGADVVVEKGRDAFQRGDYRWAAEILNHAVIAQPTNETARAWLAASYEQLGFQAESGAWRSYLLSGARELRHGVPREGALPSGNPEFLSAVATADLFDALATSYASERLQRPAFELNFVLTDTGERVLLQVGPATVVPRLGAQSDDAAATIETTRRELDRLVMGGDSSLGRIDGAMEIEGDSSAVGAYFRSLEPPPFWFEIVTP